MSLTISLEINWFRDLLSTWGAMIAGRESLRIDKKAAPLSGTEAVAFVLRFVAQDFLGILSPMFLHIFFSNNKYFCY
jgi:hypothetical protein